ncbi:hypothetical protein RclHR1_12680010 [Rhizophagus clarus]|nr:hypothetical protein RclHR1_12680010 [Rhizophagus clarus]
MNALAKDFQNDRKVKAQTWHSFFRWNGVEEWTPERMGEKKFPQVVIWDEKCQVICCGDDAQPPPFFGEMPHSWLKERADYYEEVLTDYQTKCPRLQELKKKMPKDGRKQNCLVLIPGSSEKKELVKNDIIHLPLNTLPNKFLKDMLADKKVIDWELGYDAMTIHTSQGMTLKAPQSVWVIDENLAWDNLIYLVVGRVEYLSQLIQAKAPPLPPEIAQEIEEAKKKRRLEYELKPSIQKKLIRYMDQDKEKGHDFDLTVDYILMLKQNQEDKCALCLIEMKFEWDQPGDILQ